jgi:acetyl esterase/lipase
VAERLAAATPRPRFAGSLTWLLACLILLVTTASADAAVQRGIVYGHGQVAGGMAPLRLDLYRPAVSPAPVVVLIHGGGFARGSRSDPSIARIGRALAAQGIAAACIDYRLAGSAPRPSARVAPLLAGLPRTPVRRAVAAAVDDTLTAIGFLRRNSARFGLDPRRIGLVGGSAGAMTATHVAYVLDDYGIARPPIRFVGDLWGGVIVDPPGGAQLSAFPLAAGDPPLFAVHGTADRAVPVRFSDQLVARAREIGVPAEYHRIPGRGHGFSASGFFTARLGGGPTPFERLLRFAASALRGTR